MKNTGDTGNFIKASSIKRISLTEKMSVCFLLYHSFNTGNFCVIVLERWSKRIKKKKITYISVERSGMRYLRPCILTSQSNGYFGLRGHQGTSCPVPSFCI